jgi:Transglutaminase-like superfamily/Dockerin type I domain
MNFKNIKLKLSIAVLSCGILISNLILPVLGYGVDRTYQNWTYENWNNNTEIRLVKYNTSSTSRLSVVLPKTIDGKPVTTVGYETFKGLDIACIDIADVTYFETNMFQCSNLVEITKNGISISSTDPILLKNIQAFAGCTYLKALVTNKTKSIFNELAIQYQPTTPLSNLEKLKIAYQIYAYLDNNVDYATEMPGSSFYLESALLFNQAVCKGYANAYTYLLKCAGIECQTMSAQYFSPGHAWNMVEIGGRWFHADSCWGGRAWFLKTDSVVSSETLCHKEWDVNNYINSPASLEYFTHSSILHTSTRPMGDLNGDGKLNSLDITILTNHFLKTHPLSEDVLYLADLNYNGSVNVNDLVTLKNMVLGTVK